MFGKKSLDKRVRDEQTQCLNELQYYGYGTKEAAGIIKQYKMLNEITNDNKIVRSTFLDAFGKIVVGIGSVVIPALIGAWTLNKWRTFEESGEIIVDSSEKELTRQMTRMK